MNSRTHRYTDSRKRIWILVAFPLLLVLVLPGIALLLSAGLPAVWTAVSDPIFKEALLLSLKTSILSLGLIFFFGIPMAWWFAQSDSRVARILEALVDLPVIVPPAVIGIGLLQAFGRNGIFGKVFDHWDWGIPFTFWAVILAQVVIAAPFFIRSAVVAFRELDQELIVVARTLGHSPLQILTRVVIPMSRTGWVGGLPLAWARALGEFGATLLFAGNMPGVTQTVPLAIYSALERDVHVAVALSLLLCALALVLLFLLRKFFVPVSLKERP